MKHTITPEILAFITEVNSIITGSNIVIEWEPSEVNAFRFEFHLRSEYYNEPMWSPEDKLFDLVKEKAVKHLGQKAKLYYNNTGTIIWFYFD